MRKVKKQLQKRKKNKKWKNKVIYLAISDMATGNVSIVLLPTKYSWAEAGAWKNPKYIPIPIHKSNITTNTV